MKLNLDFNNISTNEKKALLEQKELLIKKSYADKGIALKVENYFGKFICNNAGHCFYFQQKGYKGGLLCNRQRKVTII